MTNVESKQDGKELVAQDNQSIGFFNIFISTFISVFVAEIGDKTQIATLLLSAQSGKPLIVFTGAALALICSSLMVVVLSSWLFNKVSQFRIRLAASFIMISLGLWFGIQSFKGFLLQSY